MKKSPLEEKAEKRAAAVAAFDAVAGKGGFETEMRIAQNETDQQLFYVNKDLKAAEQRATAASAEMETLRAQFAAQLAAKDARIAELETEVAGERASTARQGASGKAVELLASLGHKPLALEPIDSSGQTAFEKFNSIQDPVERGRFFQQHEKEIFGHGQ
jgi:hypothetical protein